MIEKLTGKHVVAIVAVLVTGGLVVAGLVGETVYGSVIASVLQTVGQ